MNHQTLISSLLRFSLTLLSVLPVISERSNVIADGWETCIGRSRDWYYDIGVSRTTCRISFGENLPIGDFLPGSSDIRIEFDLKMSGRERFFAALGEVVIDIDGDGSVDVSSSAAPESPCHMWFPTRLYPANQKGRGCGSRLGSGEYGTTYVFHDHQWRFFSYQKNSRPNIVPMELPRTEVDDIADHRYPDDRPIAFSQRGASDQPGKMFTLSTHRWNGPAPVSWIGTDQGREIVQVTSATGQKFEIALSMDESRIDVLVDGRYSVTTWRGPNHGVVPRKADFPQGIYQHHRMRLMNRVYEDLDADGQLDGYYEFGGTMPTIIVDKNLVPVSDCDWDAGTSLNADDPAKHFRFSNGAWKPVK